VSALPVHDSPEDLVAALSASILDYADELIDDIALLVIRLGD
jgi:hypothetical protein